MRGSDTTHAHTLHKTQNENTKRKRKKQVEKGRQRKKAKYAGIKQRKARKNIVSINLQLVFINNN